MKISVAAREEQLAKEQGTYAIILAGGLGAEDGGEVLAELLSQDYTFCNSRITTALQIASCLRACCERKLNLMAIQSLNDDL